MTLKNKVLLGGQVSTAAKVFRREKNRGKNLAGRFEDWMERESDMKKQTIYNYKNLYKLMRIAPKLMNCRVNMTYFVQHHEIFMNYFEDMMNRGNATFLVIVKLVTHTLQNRQ